MLQRGVQKLYWKGMGKTWRTMSSYKGGSIQKKKEYVKASSARKSIIYPPWSHLLKLKGISLANHLFALRNESFKRANPFLNL